MKAATVGTSVEPSTTSCAPEPSTWSAGLLYCATSSGKTELYTTWTPSFSSRLSASCTGGSANGSWAIGKAAVLGRSLGGSELIHSTNGNSSSATGRLTSNTLWSAWLDGVSKTAG